MFRRISRLANSAAHQLPVLDSEWMQQTRMLFNNRTGLELKKVYVPQLDTMDGTLEIEGIEVSHEYRPHGWPEEIGEWSGLKFLHACALGDHPEEATLHHPIIERCRTVRHWKSAFRTATVLLFAGWALFLQGACRHDAPEGIMDTGQPQLSKEAIEFWEASDKKWRQLSRRREATARPFELIGMVVASAPPGIDLDRIHLSRPDGDAKNLSLVMEGSCLSGEGPAEFRQWMGHLRETTPLGRVENLKFDRQSGTLRFHLVGQTVSREGFE